GGRPPPAPRTAGQVPSSWLGRLSPPDRHLVRIPGRVPDRPRGRGPERRGRVRERAEGHRPREPRERALRGQPAGARRLVARARGDDLLDVLALAVHRPRPLPALGLPAPERGLPALPEPRDARERDRPRRVRPPADRTAADVPRLRLRGHAGAIREPQPRERSRAAPLEPSPRNAEPP